MPTAPARSASRRSSARSAQREVAGGDADRAQGAEGRAALLEGEAGGGIGDEEADDEAEEAEGGEVQVEAVAEAVEVAMPLGRVEFEPLREGGRERPGGGRGLREEAGEAVGGGEEAGGDGDVDDEGVGRDVVARLPRREVGGGGEAGGGFRARRGPGSAAAGRRAGRRCRGPARRCRAGGSGARRR